MAKTMKKLDSKLQKQQQGWPKIWNTAKSQYNKDEKKRLVRWGWLANLVVMPLAVW